MAENQILGESDFFLQLNGDVQKQWIFCGTIQASID